MLQTKNNKIICATFGIDGSWGGSIDDDTFYYATTFSTGVSIGTSLMLLLFLNLANIKSAGIYTDKPWFSEAEEIDVSDDAIYVLDGTYNNIHKYDLSGEFCFTIKFNDSGASRIFVDENNNLCRYSVRGKRVEVYTDEGELIEKFDIDRTDLVEQGRMSPSQTRQVERNDVIYGLKNRFIKDSKLLIGEDQEIVVESVAYHLFAIAYVLIFIGLVAFAGICNVICIIKKYEQNFKNQKSNY